jgi:hypothetical protein
VITKAITSKKAASIFNQNLKEKIHKKAGLDIHGVTLDEFKFILFQLHTKMGLDFQDFLLYLKLNESPYQYMKKIE